MNVESFLVRELDIRFIDARNIVGEAKVSLGIQGYPAKDQLRDLRQESLRLFEGRPEQSKSAMRRMSSDLEAIKIPSGSISSRAYASSEEFSACDSTDESKFTKRRLGDMLKRR